MGDERPPEIPTRNDRETAAVKKNGTDRTNQIGGRYRIDHVLGEGAFGRVYLATDTVLRTDVAIKELLAAPDATDTERHAQYAERFRREARAARISQHPNIVTIYDLIEDGGGNLYLVMEYVDGTNLRELLAQARSLPVERAIAIASDVAQALEAVHGHGVVHRDLKPANIMVTRGGMAKLADFGIAQMASEETMTEAAATNPGTPLYMSPEQMATHGALDGRSDLYSLGLVLYEMLVGEPYATKRRPLGTDRPDLPPGVSTVTDKLLREDAGERYQSASETVLALRGASLTGGPGQPSDTVEYPALAVAASKASRAGQRKYKQCVEWDLGLLVVGGAFSILSGFNGRLAQDTGAIVAATLMVGSIAIKATNRISHFDRAWFDGRAVAETVKKLSWFYMMGIAPYDTTENDADNQFLDRLKEVNKEQGALHLERAALSQNPLQITPKMREVRSGDFARRKAYYTEQRMRHQIAWYARKAEENARAATFWFWSTLALQAAAVAAALLKVVVGGPNLVALLAAFAAAGTAWSQVGRYDELSKTYALTATNLTFALTKIATLREETDLADLVNETEDYISREHQMWVVKHS